MHRVATVSARSGLGGDAAGVCPAVPVAAVLPLEPGFDRLATSVVNGDRRPELPGGVRDVGDDF
ncbi:MAG: hypothetical protein V3V08_03115 [Nannocystaceae bacterium]